MTAMMYAALKQTKQLVTVRDQAAQDGVNLETNFDVWRKRAKIQSSNSSELMNKNGIDSGNKTCKFLSIPKLLFHTAISKKW